MSNLIRFWKAILYCLTCGRQTAHEGQTIGAWEYYTCAECGNKQSFKVR